MIKEESGRDCKIPEVKKRVHSHTDQEKKRSVIYLLLKTGWGGGQYIYMAELKRGSIRVTHRK